MGRTETRRSKGENPTKRSSTRKTRPAPEVHHDVSELEKTTTTRVASSRAPRREAAESHRRERRQPSSVHGARSAGTVHRKTTLERAPAPAAEGPTLGDLIMRVTGAEHQMISPALLEEIVDMVIEADEPELDAAVEALQVRMKPKSSARKKKAALQILRTTVGNCTPEWIQIVSEDLLESVLSCALFVPDYRKSLDTEEKEMIAMATALLDEWAAEFGGREDRIGRAFRRAKKSTASTGAYEAPTHRGAGMVNEMYGQSATSKNYSDQSSEHRQAYLGAPSGSMSMLSRDPYYRGMEPNQREQLGDLHGYQTGGSFGYNLRQNREDHNAGGMYGYRQDYPSGSFNAQPSGLYATESEMQTFTRYGNQMDMRAIDSRDEEIRQLRQELEARNHRLPQDAPLVKAVPQLTYYSSVSGRNAPTSITASIRREFKGRNEAPSEDMSKLKLRERLQQYKPREEATAQKKGNTIVLRGRRAPPKKQLQLPAPKDKDEDFSEDEPSYSPEILSESEQGDYSEEYEEEEVDDEEEEDDQSVEEEEEEEEEVEEEVEEEEEEEEEGEEEEEEVDEEEQEEEDEEVAVKDATVQKDGDDAQAGGNLEASDEKEVAVYMPPLLDFGSDNEEDSVPGIPQESVFQNIAGHEKQVSDPQSNDPVAQNLQNYLAGAPGPYMQQPNFHGQMMGHQGNLPQGFIPGGHPQGLGPQANFVPHGGYAAQQFSQFGQPQQNQAYAFQGYGQPMHQPYAQQSHAQQGGDFYAYQYASQAPDPSGQFYQHSQSFSTPPHGTGQYQGHPHGQQFAQGRPAPPPEDPKLSSKKKSGMTSVAFTDLSLMALGGGT